MPSAAFATATLYNQSPGDLLFVDVSLRVTSNGWAQPDGKWGAIGTARLFDVRPYRSVLVTLSVATITGGTTPTITPLLMAHDYPEPNMGDAGGAIAITPASAIPAAGGAQQILAGEQATSAISGGTYGAIAPLIVPVRLIAVKLGLTITGGPSVVTNGRLFFWGLR